MGYVTDYEVKEDVALTRYMSGVYAMMFCALLLSAGAAWIVADSNYLTELIYGNKLVFYGLIAVEFILVLGIGGLLERASYGKLNLMFIAYSVVNGATLSYIFFAYTLTSIFSVFIVAALTFGGCAMVGYFVKKDMSSMGRYLMYALIGLVIATLVNMFFHIEGFAAVLNYVGVAIFLGLTVYDTWKLKNAGYHLIEDEETKKKFALIGALNLYLDFINLFIYLLRILGDRKN